MRTREKVTITRQFNKRVTIAALSVRYGHTEAEIEDVLRWALDNFHLTFGNGWVRL